MAPIVCTCSFILFFSFTTGCDWPAYISIKRWLRIHWFSCSVFFLLVLNIVLHSWERHFLVLISTLSIFYFPVIFVEQRRQNEIKQLTFIQRLTILCATHKNGVVHSQSWMPHDQVFSWKERNSALIRHGWEPSPPLRNWHVWCLKEFSADKVMPSYISSLVSPHHPLVSSARCYRAISWHCVIFSPTPSGYDDGWVPQWIITVLWKPFPH